MTKPIQNIVIVGGGSAGWMTAAYLNKVLARETAPVSIQVVESEDIGIIGVGEATVPTIREFFALIDLPEIELLVKTNATLKAAIRFENWSEKGRGYYHPFEAPGFSDGIDAAGHWVAEALKGNVHGDFAAGTGILPALCDTKKVPKLFDSPEYDAPTAYAYHLDAVQLGQHLRTLSVQRGVEHLVDTITDVTLDMDGAIESLSTASGQTLTADFYIDCTGFASVLIEKNLGQGFRSYADELFCDRAIAMPTQHANDNPVLESCTIATAQSAGWTWAIDLATRRGNGYVYSSRHQSEDAAEVEFRNHLGAAAQDVEARHLRMRVGRRDNFWHKNCLAIGLAGGFIEPLESTGLQLIEVGLRMFFDHFPNGSGDQHLAKRYNRVMGQIYDDVKDFIVLHYHLTKREDTQFWQDCQNELKPSAALAERLELWRHKLPSTSDLGLDALFGSINYQYVLAGMDRLLPDQLPIMSSIPSQRSAALLHELGKIRQQALSLSPTQSDYVTRMRAPFESPTVTAAG